MDAIPPAGGRSLRRLQKLTQRILTNSSVGKYVSVMIFSPTLADILFNAANHSYTAHILC